MIDRLKWLLIRRPRLAMTLDGFGASWHSHATPACRFSEHNRLYGRTTIVDSSLGRFTYVTDSYIGYAQVGSFCSIASSGVGGMGRHPSEWLSTHPVFYSTRGQTAVTFADEDYFAEYAPVTLGHDVWVGGARADHRRGQGGERSHHSGRRRGDGGRTRLRHRGGCAGTDHPLPVR